METQVEADVRECRVCGLTYRVVKPWQKSCSAKCNSVVGNGRKRPDPNVKRCRTCLQHLPLEDFELAHRSCRPCEQLQASGRKRCGKCRQIKEHSDFHKRANRPDGYESNCRACRSAYTKVLNAKPERKRANRDKKLRLKYGIGAEEVDAMYESQQGRCDICRTSRQLEQLHVDHDHSTGAVRALLCLNCNSMLGHAKDKVAILRAAIHYLERHAHVQNLEP